MPALQPLKLVAGLELRGRGDVQMYRVELPGPKVTKDIAADAKVHAVDLALALQRARDQGPRPRLARGVRARRRQGDRIEQVMKLIVNVVERQEERSRTRKAQQR